MQNPDATKAITELTVLNSQVIDTNQAYNIPKTLLQSFTIDTSTFHAIFRAAATIPERLRKSHTNIKALAKFDAFNKQLQEFNWLH